MNVISLQNIEKSYGTRLLFHRCVHNIYKSKRLGPCGNPMELVNQLFKDFNRPDGV